MKRIIRFTVTAGMLICVIAPCALFGMTSDNYHLKSSVLASGGAPMSTSAYGLKSSTAQPTPTVSSASDNYQCYSGFWSYLTKSYLMGDVNGDNQVDLQDIIMTLKVLTNITTEGVRWSGDVNEDDKIGNEEAIYILQDVSEIK